tara:strand:- start:214 stop:849 length:636 start_codon:yes stop_codon:yes gene_type:complete
LKSIDHPIFQESIRYIQSRLGYTGFNSIEQDVLERLIHSSGDFGIQSLLKFTPGACESGVIALKEGARIITDTNMAASAITPMSSKTLNASVNSILEWVPSDYEKEEPRTVIGMKKAWEEFSYKFSSDTPPIVVIGSAPKALLALLDMISEGLMKPSLVIGMPVGFISVLESKKRLAKSTIHHIRIEGNKGGAAMAAASVNALLRYSMIEK